MNWTGEYYAKWNKDKYPKPHLSMAYIERNIIDIDDIEWRHIFGLRLWNWLRVRMCFRIWIWFRIWERCHFRFFGGYWDRGSGGLEKLCILYYKHEYFCQHDGCSGGGKYLLVKRWVLDILWAKLTHEQLCSYLPVIRFKYY